ncbi:thioredoxin reductase (NADPH) [Lachnospiraceae bacterium XBB1006]|nr:thioredoxin reductase (NADPH) [Lachnospiraceae bacterium XBB1006]
MNKVYDCVILGAGPGGLSAGIYSGRNRLDTLLIEQGQVGGQIALTAEIENYPGQSLFGETGITLSERMRDQADQFGVERVTDCIEKVELAGDVKVLYGKNETYQARAVILATGAYPRPIGCKGEGRFVGSGVSYCATCDGAFFTDLEVYVVGGGDSAVEEAIFLTQYARKVTIVHRRDELRAAKSIQEKAFANPKIAFLWDSVVEELKGDDVLNAMTVRNVKTGVLTEIRADEQDGMFGVFGFLGTIPRTTLFEGQLTLENGYIVTDEDMKTNIEGVFAVGDVRKKKLRQVVTAAADGAVAAMEVFSFLQER